MPDLVQLSAEVRELEDLLETLNDTIAEQARLVAENTAVQERQARRIERAEKLATRTAVFVSVLVLLCGLLALLGFRQVVTEDRLNQVVAAERTARQEGQCPLLALFLGSYNPNSRAAGEDRAKYEEAFTRIRGIYARLDCQDTQPVVPGSTATPPTTR